MKKTFKKMIFGMLLVLCTGCFAGCGSSTQEDEKTQELEEEQEMYQNAVDGYQATIDNLERQQKELEDFQRKQEEYQKAMDNAALLFLRIKPLLLLMPRMNMTTMR